MTTRRPSSSNSSNFKLFQCRWLKMDIAFNVNVGGGSPRMTQRIFQFAWFAQHENRIVRWSSSWCATWAKLTTTTSASLGIAQAGGGSEPTDDQTIQSIDERASCRDEVL